MYVLGAAGRGRGGAGASPLVLLLALVLDRARGVRGRLRDRGPRADGGRGDGLGDERVLRVAVLRGGLAPAAADARRDPDDRRVHAARGGQRGARRRLVRAAVPDARRCWSWRCGPWSGCRWRPGCSGGRDGHVVALPLESFRSLDAGCGPPESGRRPGRSSARRPAPLRAEPASTVSSFVHLRHRSHAPARGSAGTCPRRSGTCPTARKVRMMSSSTRRRSAWVATATLSAASLLAICGVSPRDGRPGARDARRPGRRPREGRRAPTASTRSASSPSTRRSRTPPTATSARRASRTTPSRPSSSRPPTTATRRRRRPTPTGSGSRRCTARSPGTGPR